jgi:hypothetical protein
MMSGVSHAQRPPRQRLRSNGLLLRDFWLVGHPEASMPPEAGTPDSTFFDVCRAFSPTDLVGRSSQLGFPARLGVRDNLDRGAVALI